MAFQANRLKALREAKGFSQERLAEIAGVSQSVLAKAEGGKSVPRGAALDSLAGALDCPMDYLFGRCGEYENARSAAVQLSFQVFVQEENLTDEQREQCRRTLTHPQAPTTAQKWRTFVELMDLAVGSKAPHLTLVDRRPFRKQSGSTRVRSLAGRLDQKH